MMNFTEWNNRDEPQGLEGVKKRILSEGKAARIKVFKDPNVVDPKIVAQAKAREADADKRAAIAKDRAVGNVDDPFQNAPRQEKITQQKKPLSLKPNTSLGGGGGTKPPTKPPVASVPEPDDGTGGKLDDVLKDIQGKSSEEGPGKRVIQKIREALKSHKGVKSKALLEIEKRLGDERSGILEQTINEYSKLYSKENIEQFKESNNFQTVDQAYNFMRDVLQMEDIDGRLGFKQHSIPESLARGLSPAKGFRPSKVFQYHDKFSDSDLSHVEGVRGGTSGEVSYDGLRQFHKKHLKNNINTVFAREVFSRLDSSVQKKLNGMGAPTGDQTGVFDPREDWNMEYNFDSENGFIGDSNMDLDQFDGKLGYDRNDGVAGDDRGIMLLQKLLSTGFTDEVTGVPVFAGINGFTADHIVGRKDGGRDTPQNLAMVSEGMNQLKSGTSKKHGNDSFNKVLNGEMRSPNAFRKLFGEDPEGLEDFTESGDFLSWAMEKLNSAHFSDKITKRVKEKADTNGDGTVSDSEKMEFITDLQDLVDMDPQTMKQYMLNSGDNSDVHMNLANLTKLVPTKPESVTGKPVEAVNRNSWRGGSGFGYDKDAKTTGIPNLEGFRKSMLVRMLTDKKLQSDIIGARGSGKSESKIKEQVRKLRKKFAEENLQIPMQGIAAAFGLGRMNNKEMAERFQEMGTRYLSSIKESHPEIHDKLMEQLTGGDGIPGLSHWGDEELKKYMGGADAPEEFPQNDQRVLDMMGIDERGAQLMRSVAGRSFLSPEEIDQFYADLKKPSASNRKEFLGRDFDQKLGPFGENWLTPNTNLL